MQQNDCRPSRSRATQRFLVRPSHFLWGSVAFRLAPHTARRAGREHRKKQRTLPVNAMHEFDAQAHKNKFNPPTHPKMKKLVFLTLWLMPVLLHSVRQRSRTDKARSPLSRRHLGANCVEFSLHRRRALPFHPGDCAGRNDLSRAGDSPQRGRPDEEGV